ncbi:hypothetical protein MTP03_44660 [Tsukamurella sp. PLM1]|nr:hypothetical protein MTP03_44660 [Tsukamurella sp. PLM1]
MFVKVCGLRTPETVDAAVVAGADAVGFVFAPGSVRLIDPDGAAALVARVPGDVETVGVFRKQPIDEVLAVARAAGVRTIQLHGDEPDEHFARAAEAGFGTIRAVSAARYSGSGHAGPGRLLIDATVPGSGEPFDPADLPVPRDRMAPGRRPASGQRDRPDRRLRSVGRGRLQRRRVRAGRQGSGVDPGIPGRRPRLTR